MKYSFEFPPLYRCASPRQPAVCAAYFGGIASDPCNGAGAFASVVGVKCISLYCLETTMTPEERQLLSALADRVKSVPAQQKRPRSGAIPASTCAGKARYALYPRPKP